VEENTITAPDVFLVDKPLKIGKVAAMKSDLKL